MRIQVLQSLQILQEPLGSLKEQKLLGVVGGGNNLRQTGPYHNYKDTLFCLQMTEES